MHSILSLPRSFLSLAIIFLAACGSLPPRHLPHQLEHLWQEHQIRVENLQNWTLKSRISIKTSEGAWQANLNWKQIGKHYQMNIYNAFGQGLAELTSADEVIRLHLHDKQTFYAENAQALLKEHLNWDIPVQILHFWIRGIPSPDQPFFKKLNPVGQLQQLNQAGWVIHYIQYKKHYKNGTIDMPSKIVIQNADLKLKISIHSWQLEPLNLE